MEKLIKNILKEELGENLHSIIPINGFGTINKVFEIKNDKSEYIIRLNNDPSAALEYQKEAWCMEQTASLGIPSPKVIRMGRREQYSYMIQNKLNGISGMLCKAKEKELIWKNLGQYAAKYHQIQQIEVKEVVEAEFHENWKSRLLYNIKELNENDSLLKKKILTRKEQHKAKEMLSTLSAITFETGLVHGDLGPRNVIWLDGLVQLIDWGSAEINVVPHNEIGIVLMSKEATQKEFNCFLEGLGIAPTDYQQIEQEVKLLNLLHRLDKYRWAEGHEVENINDFETSVKATFDRLP